jgi:hypothetical protein
MDVQAPQERRDWRATDIKFRAQINQMSRAINQLVD